MSGERIDIILDQIRDLHDKLLADGYSVRFVGREVQLIEAASPRPADDGSSGLPPADDDLPSALGEEPIPGG